MKKLSNLFAALLLAGTALAQQPTFSKVYYDDFGNEQAYGVAITTDSNFMVAGERDQNGLLMKVDAGGNLLWSKKIGNDDNTRFTAIIPTNDSNFMLMGSCKNALSAQKDIFLVKVNVLGDTLWSKAIDLGADGYATSIKQTNDQGYIVCGTVLQYVTPPYTNMFVLKLDAGGGLSWVKKITCANRENKANSVKQLPDSGYIVMGSIEEYTGSTFINNGCLLRLKADGTLLWARSLGPSPMNGLDVVLTHNGFVCLFDLGLANGCAIAKTDLSGNIVWSKRNYQYSSNMINSVVPPILCATGDGGFVYRSGDSFGPTHLVKIDSLGQLAWSKFVYLIIFHVLQTPDSGILVLGNGPIYGIKTNLTTNQQIGMIKTDAHGNNLVSCVYDQTITSDTILMTSVAVTCTTATGGTIMPKHPVMENIILSVINGCVAYLGSIGENHALQITAYSNPASNTLFIEIENGNENAELSMYDVHGRLVLQQVLQSSATQVDISRLSSGLYIIKLLTVEGVGVKKFIKE